MMIRSAMVLPFLYADNTVLQAEIEYICSECWTDCMNDATRCKASKIKETETYSVVFNKDDGVNSCK